MSINANEGGTGCQQSAGNNTGEAATSWQCVAGSRPTGYTGSGDIFPACERAARVPRRATAHTRHGHGAPKVKAMEAVPRCVYELETTPRIREESADEATERSGIPGNYHRWALSPLLLITRPATCATPTGSPTPRPSRGRASNGRTGAFDLSVSEFRRP